MSEEPKPKAKRKYTRPHKSGSVKGPGTGPGRPSEYSAEIGERICDELVMGRTLTAICEEEWAPHRTVVFRWRRKYPEFDDDYLAARTAQIELRGDECLDIAVDDKIDIQRARIMIDARRVILARLSAVYLTTSDDDKGSPLIAEMLQKARATHDRLRAEANGGLKT